MLVFLFVRIFANFVGSIFILKIGDDGMLGSEHRKDSMLENDNTISAGVTPCRKMQEGANTMTTILEEDSSSKTIRKKRSGGEARIQPK